MLEWTGERFLPWLDEPAMAYEHLHRYAYAAQFVRNKCVLDMASGEGYGADLLAGTAAWTVGIDYDEAAVRHAVSRYARANLQYLCGSITSVPIRGVFDVIVCFEAIEHIEHQELLLEEVKRLLTPEGLFIASTPNKTLYRQSDKENRYHVRELSRREFKELIGRHFHNVMWFGQRTHPHSNIWPLTRAGNHGAVQEQIVDRQDGEFAFISQERRSPLYMIALASDSTIPQAAGSILVDHSDGLFRQKDSAIEWRTEQVAERDREIRSLMERIHAQTVEILRQEAEIARQKHIIDQILHSRSWRLTAPLRSLKKRLQKYWRIGSGR